GNLLHRGGINSLYRLSDVRTQPDYKATVAEHSLVIKPGATNDFKVAVNRMNELTNAISVRIAGLPEGVSAEPAEAPEKKGEVTLKLISVTNAPPFSGAIRVVTTSEQTER